MTLRVRSFIWLVVAAGSSSACKKKPETAPVPVVVPPPAPPAPVVTTRTPAPRPPAPVDNSAEIARVAAVIAAAKVTIAQTIYFDYDKDAIRDDARAVLDAKVPVLQANPTLRIRIAGHTDERGSNEYNVALGQKRAAAASRYLVGRGIAESRIDIVSFGEERPAMTGEGEALWEKNRRDEFEIVAGEIKPAGR